MVIKTLPLISASLKGFMRNWKAIILLVLFPLLLISSVFLSFNPNGLRKIPVGIIWPEPLDIGEFESVVSTFLRLTDFNSLDGCLQELRAYQQYTCVVVSKENALILTVYFDNTREPVIWEIIERIKTAVDYVQKQQSRQMASDFLGRFKSTMGKVENFKTQLAAAQPVLNQYVGQTESSIQNLRAARTELAGTLTQMDTDIATVKSAKNLVTLQKNKLFYDGLTAIDTIDYSAHQITNLSYPQNIALATIQSQIDTVRLELREYDNAVEDYLGEVDGKIRSYESKSSAGRGYLTGMDTKISELQNIKEKLVTLQGTLTQAQTDIEAIYHEFQNIGSLDPEILVNPVVVRNTPTYVPEVSAQDAKKLKGSDAQKIVTGFNLISLQTIYPTILFLIVLFLAMLISSFICLYDINSPATRRLQLIKGIFIHEFFSCYLSSLLIMVLPVACVLLLGQVIFRIPIMEHGAAVSVLMFLFASIFTLGGMCLAYLVRKESIALIISTFLLVFLIFFSGFLLPIERMGETVGNIAFLLPGKIALTAFNQIVFYNAKLSMVMPLLRVLMGWFFGFLILGLLIKKLREKSN